MSRMRWVINILLVFLISGLWHGANWTYVIWGGIHSLFYFISRWTTGLRTRFGEIIKVNYIPNIYNFCQIVVTFNLVCFAWIFFRADSIADAITITKKIFISVMNLSTVTLDFDMFFSLAWIPLDFELLELFIALLAIGVMETIHYFQKTKPFCTFLRMKPTALRWSFYCMMTWAILIFGKYGDNAKEFVYFQF